MPSSEKINWNENCKAFNLRRKKHDEQKFIIGCLKNTQQGSVLNLKSKYLAFTKI